MKGMSVVAVAAVLAIATAGCGSDDSSGRASVSAAPPSGALTSDDQAAISDTITTWLTEGGCERMTDKFLEAQTFISEPEKACSAFESQFSAPGFSADDVVVSDIQGADGKATATVGDDSTDITSKYRLVFEDGAWKIDSADL